MDLASVVAALASVGVRVSGSTPNNNIQEDSSRACPTGLAGPEPSGTHNDPGQHFQDSTPTEGRGTSQGRRWGKRWSACWRGGRERRLSGGIASVGWGQRNSGKWGHCSQQLCCGGAGSQRKSRTCIPRPLLGGSLPAREKSHGLCGGRGGRAGLLHEAGLHALVVAVMDTPGDRLRGRGSFPTCWGIA